MSVISKRVYNDQAKHSKQELKVVLLGTEDEGKPGGQAAAATGAVDKSTACCNGSDSKEQSLPRGRPGVSFDAYFRLK